MIQMHLEAVYMEGPPEGGGDEGWAEYKCISRNPAPTHSGGESSHRIG